MVNFGIQHIGRRPTHAGGDQAESGLIVDRFLVLGEDDESWAGGVETRIHPGGELDAASESESDVRIVTHPVGLECTLDLVGDRLVRRNFCKGHREGGASESIKVGVESKNLSIVYA